MPEKLNNDTLKDLFEKSNALHSRLHIILVSLDHIIEVYLMKKVTSLMCIALYSVKDDSVFSHHCSRPCFSARYTYILNAILSPCIAGCELTSSLVNGIAKSAPSPGDSTLLAGMNVFTGYGQITQL